MNSLNSKEKILKNFGFSSKISIFQTLLSATNLKVEGSLKIINDIIMNTSWAVPSSGQLSL